MAALKVAIMFCLILFIIYCVLIVKKHMPCLHKDMASMEPSEKDGDLSQQDNEELMSESAGEEQLKEEIPKKLEADEVQGGSSDLVDESCHEASFEDCFTEQNIEVEQDLETIPLEGFPFEEWPSSKEDEAVSDEGESEKDKDILILEDEILSIENESHDQIMEMAITNEKKGGIASMPLIQAQVLIGEGTIQTMLESTVTLDLPAVKVKEIRAEVRDVTTNIIEDKVIIQAVVHKQIFFIGTDAVVHHQAEDIPVSYFVDITGAAPGMDVSVTPTVEHVTYSLLDSTTLHQKVILLFNAVVTQTQLLDVEEGADPTLYYVATVIGQGSQQLIVENGVTLSNPAQKVDEITAEVRDIVTDITNDKIVIQGILHKQIYYVGTDNVEYHQAEDVPFSLFVDVTGAAPGMDVTVTNVIENISYTLENETELTQRVVILFSVVVTQNIQINLVEGTDPAILVEQVMGEDQGQTLLQDVVTMDRPTQKIRSIDAEVSEISCQVIPDKVIIEGTIHKQIYYIGTDDVEYEQGEDVDFSFFVDLPGATPDMNCTVVPTIESVIHELQNETQMLEKVVLQVSVMVSNTVEFTPSLVTP